MPRAPLTNLPVVAASLFVSSAVTAQPIQREADGQWQSNYSAPSGIRYGWYWDANVWIDVTVENLAYEKGIGVVWTTDGWSTWHTAQAIHERTLPDGRERWGFDLSPAARMSSCFWCPEKQVTLEYALYFVVNGATYWDNDGGANYRVSIAPRYE